MAGACMAGLVIYNSPDFNPGGFTYTCSGQLATEQDSVVLTAWIRRVTPFSNLMHACAEIWMGGLFLLLLGGALYLPPVSLSKAGAQAARVAQERDKPAQRRAKRLCILGLLCTIGGFVAMLIVGSDPNIGCFTEGPNSVPWPGMNISPGEAEWEWESIPLLILLHACDAVFRDGVFFLLLGGVMYLISKLKQRNNLN
jgi:hypothetical protein